MRLPPDKVCRLIRKLYASTSSPFEHEAEVAKEKLRVLLFEHSLTEADIPAILAATDDHGQKLSSASFPSAGAGPTINVFDLNSALIDDHVTVTVRERTAISLPSRAYRYDRAARSARWRGRDPALARNPETSRCQPYRNHRPCQWL